MESADWTLKRGESTRKSKRNEKARRIGRWSGEKARGSPKVPIKSGRLDVGAERKHEEVQKGRESETDWTLERRESTRKSKRSKKPYQIGR